MLEDCTHKQTTQTQHSPHTVLLTLWCIALYMGGICSMSPVSFWAASVSWASAEEKQRRQ